MRGLLLLGAVVAALTASAQAETFQERARENACPAAERGAASARLEQLRTEDQADRSGGSHGDTSAVDRARREEVATLFARGCFSSGRDYHNAALIFQHGPVPEHHYQTYLWATRAVELGDSEAAWLIPRAIDRHLMNRGMKQLFATNLVSDRFYLPPGEGSGVWCVWPNVSAPPSLTEEQRAAMRVAPLSAMIARATSMNNGAASGQCPLELPEPPRGLFPGYW